MKESHHPFRNPEAKEKYLTHYNERAKRWPVACESLYVETSFGKTFVRRNGPPSCHSQPLLLLLPGDSENSLAWIPMLQTGLSTNRRTYAIDHIYDFGKSVSTRPLATPCDFVQWLDELITALLILESKNDSDSQQQQKINLMGHSYGGWQAALYSASHPEKVNKMILLAPNGIVRPRLAVLLRGMLYWYFPLRSIVRPYLYWYAPVAIKTEETRQEVDEMVEHTVLAFQCFKRRSFVPPTVLSEQIWEVLLENEVASLVFVGDKEVTYSADRAVKHLGRMAPHVTTLKVDNADHHLALVQPDFITKVACNFLATEELAS